jgi:hypothetical protein
MLQIGSTAGRQATVSEIQAMEANLAQVRDLGVTDYRNYVITYHCVTVRYISVQNEALFQATVSAILNSYYDVNSAASNAFSLFTDIDLTTLTARFPYTLSPLGLEVSYQFYQKSSYSLTASTGYFGFSSSKSVIGGMTGVFTGTGTPPGIGVLETYSETYNTSTPTVYDIRNSSGTIVGTHDYPNDKVFIQFPTAWTGTLELFAPPKNRSNFTSASRYNIRQLQSTPLPNPLPPGVLSASVVNKILFVKYVP